MLVRLSLALLPMGCAHDERLSDAVMPDTVSESRAERNQPSARPRYTETNVCWRENYLTNCNR